MAPNNMDISFIIPAFNEESKIEDTLISIKQHVPNSLTYEIIVIDHQSTDNTRSIALRYTKQVLTTDAISVAQIRNIGAQLSTGRILIFLDADVILTDEWHQEFPLTNALMNENPAIITGSWCDIPNNASFLERYWFSPPKENKPRHIGTGHLIIAKIIFTKIHGFDESLETGEDYDLCRRAVGIGCSIEDNIKLKVIHTDYPKNLLDFITREGWHGKGDFSSYSRILNSKVALLSLLFLFLHTLLLINLITNPNYWSLVYILLIFLLCLFSSYTKYSQNGLKTILINSYIYYFYFLGRSYSFFQTTYLKLRRNTHKKSSS
jgi:glycosyltransferase involved in cell wall biosynthesis